MKLHFESKLDFQLAAIEATCDLFAGQETGQSAFTVTKYAVGRQQTLQAVDGGSGTGPQEDLFDEQGVGNKLRLDGDALLENLREVQLRGGLAPDGEIESGDFTIEMETGTGKTYVYLRTMFELNERYGFSKFVVVVPSVAIKEGVYKTLQITREHFEGLYAGTPYDYFTYDSSKLGQVRNFATSSHIQIMVVTVGAINKKTVNNIYMESEKTGGEKPIDLIRNTRPVVIVDEPQSVDGGLSGKGKEALGAMSPLCTLRYSATHADAHHMIYRLDAVDAYAKRLVKQIEVASATIEDASNKPYVRLETIVKGSVPSAKVELDVRAKAGGVQRKVVKVADGDDLAQTTGRDLYEGCRVGEVSAQDGNQFMELKYPGGEIMLEPDGSWGDVDADAINRQMIRRTISEHFEKELRLRDQGIKVLSLFFIDAVDRYRQYDEDGSEVPGAYAEMFEAEFQAVAKQPRYKELFDEGADLAVAASESHEGYFSIDKKRRWVDTGESNEKGREEAERAYNLIMRDKEKLLSFKTPLRFIFSHSALREGWDNPNVFQICALRDIRTRRERRQTIGRGLRLCVNQDGERVHGFDVNTLTVMATEGYEEFAEGLQQEIEDETGIRFGVVERHEFVGVTTAGSGDSPGPLGVDGSEELWDHLLSTKYISSSGKVQDKLRVDLKAGKLDLPAELEPAAGEIAEILKRLSGGLEIKNADERRDVKVRKAVLDSGEFKELWDRIKHRTTYRVKFDEAQLVAACTDELKQMPNVARPRLVFSKGGMRITKGGVSAEEKESGHAVTIDEGDLEKPDLLTVLQDRTQLTRRSILEIVLESERLSEFEKNPQQFIDYAAELINRRKRLALVDGIKYERLGEDAYYGQELFLENELTAYLRNSLVKAEKSVMEPVVYDSGLELEFAKDLENHPTVKVYAKLPGWFKVPTPLGTYNPDWAVLAEDEEGERLYLVVETKGSLVLGDLRESEAGKIRCGEAHFEALAVGENPARYRRATELSDVL